MKKLQNTHSFAKKAIAVCLSIAMIVPAVVANIGGSDAQAADLPTPIATFQAGEAKDYDADGANKPSVVTVEGQTAFTKAWELKNTIIKTEGQEADTDSSVTVVNPFAGMTELHEEWTTQEVDGVQLPIWNNGVTITYWVKAANVENNNSAVISFVSEDTLTYNKDDEAKHRIAVTYSPEKKNDPTSEFYLKICDEPFVDRQGESHVVYNFSAYAKAKGVDDLASEAAVPTLCGYNPEFVEGAYYYCDAVDAEGNPTKKFSEGNCLPMPNSVHKDDATQFATYDINQGSWVRQAYVDGALQLTSDNSFFFGEEMAKGVSINPNRPDYAEKKETGMQQRNNVKIAGEGTATKDTANWYFIAYTITNDYMEAYVNGEPMGLIDMGISDYSAFAQKSFNGGTGFQSPYNTTGASYLYTDANCNAKPLLDWLTMYNTELKIGGASVPVGLSAWSNAVDATREVSPITDTVAGTQIAKVSCYAEVLDDDTIADIYKAGDTVNVPEPTPRPTPSTPVDPTPTPSTPVDPTPTPSTPVDPTPTPSTPVDPTPTPSTPVDPTPTPSTPVDPTPTPTDAPEVLYGDVDLNGTVEAADALETLKAVVKLVELTEEQAKAAEVTKDGNVTAEDALEILKKVVKLIDKFPVEA